MLPEPQPQVTAPDEGPAFWFLNTLMTLKATSASTRGAFSLFHQVAPAGFATPLHVHNTEDEVFYVLTGELTFFVGDARHELAPGSYIFLPRHIPHGFRVKGRDPATLLVMAMPGDGFEAFLHEMGEPATERVLPAPTPPNMPKLTRLASQYCGDTLGPLPA